MNVSRIFKAILCTLVLSATTILSAQTIDGGNANVAASGPRPVTITGQDARNLFDILRRARLPSPRIPTFGATTVSADQAYCTRAVVPNAMANCVLTKTVDNVRTDRNVINQDANDLHDLIAKYVGVRPSQDVGFGVSHAAALQVICSIPVVLNAVPTCIMTDIDSAP